MEKKWWLDQEGRLYCIRNNEIIRPDMDRAFWTDSAFQTREGVFFRKELGENEYLMDICQVEDGSIIVLMRDGISMKLKEMNPDSGRMEEIQNISADNAGDMISAEGKDVLMLDRKGIRKYSFEDKAISDVVSFEGSAYVLKKNNYTFGEYLVKDDFRILEDGRIELLWSDGTVEYLSRQEIKTDKEIIVLRIGIAHSWIKEQVVKFNQKSEKYYVQLEEQGDAESREFREYTDMELGAGRGADIISSDAVNDAYSLLEKGVFEELEPLMEQSCIRVEDYFPGAFSGWRYNDKIYGVNFTAEVEGMCIDQELMGEEGISGAEDLINRLLACEEDAVFQRNLNAAGVLRYFLQDSGSLCGMVDFENGTCDFGSELFGKMLEAAKRYGDESGREEWKCLTSRRLYHSFYCFNDSSYLSKTGQTEIGFLFDDGKSAEMRTNNILAVNASSDKKEGAWEFVSFLLGEEVQSDFGVKESKEAPGRGVNMGSFPVSRSAFEKLCGEHSQVINDGQDTVIESSYYGIKTVITGLTQERKEELRTTLEEAQTAPLHTKTVLGIILEEAKEYFSGVKTIEQVRESLENRVQLYLNEKR